MSDRAYTKAKAQQKTLSGLSPKNSLLQRTCACGQHTIAGGECSTCRSERSTLLRSQRAFGPPSAPVAAQGNAPAQEHVSSFNSAFDRASRFGYDFSRIPIHTMQTTVPQTKLKVNQPGDVYEREADQVAEQVMRMTDPGPGSPPVVNRTALSQPTLQKKDDADAIELDFVTTDPVEEARLKKMGITLPPGIQQTNPEDKCPKGYQLMKRATWFRCDESAGTKRLGCAFCTPQGQQCKCTDVLQSLGHNRIIAPRKSGQCGDWFKITSPKKGAPILDVIKAEIPGGKTDLDIHREVIKQLGEDVDAGRYDVCLKGPEIHDDRLVPCGGSKCPTPKSSSKKKG